MIDLRRTKRLHNVLSSRPVFSFLDHYLAALFHLLPYRFQMGWNRPIFETHILSARYRLTVCFERHEVGIKENLVQLCGAEFYVVSRLLSDVEDEFRQTLTALLTILSKR